MARDGKPLDLPGLYWDEERRRYFPIASRPKRKTIDEDQAQAATTFTTDGRPVQVQPAAMSRYLKACRTGSGSYSQRVRIAE